ncbi:MAG: chalcone isomerase family protein [Porticoccaceae bacterium]|nr:chalcone isomerase family protein [Porticoccaceae bacterium]
MKTVARLLTLLALQLALPASASSGVFESSVQLDNQQLQLCNSANIKVMGMFSLGTAALYLQDCSLKHEPLKQPMQLSIVYKRDFSPQDFQKSAYKLLKRNLSKTQFSAVESELKNFNSNYQAITKGDRYDICFSEKTGLLLRKNGALISQSQSEALGQSYFLIWFGERPFSKSLKKKLLQSL